MMMFLRQKRSIDFLYRKFAVAIMLTVILLLAGNAAEAAKLTLRWNASPEENVAGYMVHFGTSSSQYDQSIDVGKAQRVTIPDLESGRTYYFATSAYDDYGFNSDMSQEVVFTIQDGQAMLQGNNPTINLLVLP